MVRQVQKDLPKHSLTLTGHSMGGLMAMVTAARQPKVLKAMTFAPTPFHVIMNDELKFPGGGCAFQFSSWREI